MESTFRQESACIHIHIHIHIHYGVNIPPRMFVYTFIHIYIYIYVYPIYIYIYTYAYSHTYTYTYTCRHGNIHIYMYIYICTYTRTCSRGAGTSLKAGQRILGAWWSATLETMHRCSRCRGSSSLSSSFSHRLVPPVGLQQRCIQGPFRPLSGQQDRSGFPLMVCANVGSSLRFRPRCWTESFDIKQVVEAERQVSATNGVSGRLFQKHCSMVSAIGVDVRSEPRQACH